MLVTAASGSQGEREPPSVWGVEPVELPPAGAPLVMHEHVFSSNPGEGHGIATEHVRPQPTTAAKDRRPLAAAAANLKQLRAMSRSKQA